MYVWLLVGYRYENVGGVLVEANVRNVASGRTTPSILRTESTFTRRNTCTRIVLYGIVAYCAAEYERSKRI